MKFLRFYDEDNLKTAILNDKSLISLNGDILDMISLFKNNSPDDFSKIKDLIGESYSLEDIEFASPVSPSKVVCLGLNFVDHANELEMDLPKVPRIFIKPSSSVIAHEEAIVFPDMANELDYEAELAVVILKEAKDVELANANDYIAGYTCLNDVTARDLQREDEQWTRSKSFDTFCPLGPVIETEFSYGDENISSILNDEVKQSSSFKNMIFSPEEMIEFISSVMTLYPGDVIAMGTPPGIGHMQKGDVIKIDISGIGTLKNDVI